VFLFVFSCLWFVCFRVRVREAIIDVWVQVNTPVTLTCGQPLGTLKLVTLVLQPKGVTSAMF